VYEELLVKLKTNLIIQHSEDDTYLSLLLVTAVAYAEDYQKKSPGFYLEFPMRETTELAVIMLASHFYESRDGSTGGFFGDNVQAAAQAMETINFLLGMNKDVVF
jgi:hypothetical protein